MDVRKRMQMIRLLEKMEKDPGYSKRLGLNNKSQFLKKDEVDDRC